MIALSNANNAIVEAYCYDAFGQVKINTSAGTDNNWLTPDGTPVSVSAIGNRFMFTGREYDAETGLYCYRARMYSPLLGRFLQPDPIGYADSMNLYQYCGNNPVNWIDPWGLEEESQKEPSGWKKALNFVKHLIVNFLAPDVVEKGVNRGVEAGQDMAENTRKASGHMQNTDDPMKMAEALEKQKKLNGESMGNALKRQGAKALEDGVELVEDFATGKVAGKIKKLFPKPLQEIYDKSKKTKSTCDKTTDAIDKAQQSDQEIAK